MSPAIDTGVATALDRILRANVEEQQRGVEPGEQLERRPAPLRAPPRRLPSRLFPFNRRVPGPPSEPPIEPSEEAPPSGAPGEAERILGRDSDLPLTQVSKDEFELARREAQGVYYRPLSDTEWEALKGTIPENNIRESMQWLDILSRTFGAIVTLPLTAGGV